MAKAKKKSDPLAEQTTEQRKAATLAHYSAKYVCCHTLAQVLYIMDERTSNANRPPLMLSTSMTNFDTGKHRCALLVNMLGSNGGYIELPHCPFCARKLQWSHGDDVSATADRDPKLVSDVEAVAAQKGANP